MNKLQKTVKADLGRRWQFIPLPIRLRGTRRNADGVPLVRIGRVTTGTWLGQQSASGYVLIGTGGGYCHIVPLDVVRNILP